MFLAYPYPLTMSKTNLAMDQFIDTQLTSYSGARSMDVGQEPEAVGFATKLKIFLWQPIRKGSSCL